MVRTFLIHFKGLMSKEVQQQEIKSPTFTSNLPQLRCQALPQAGNAPVKACCLRSSCHAQM